MKLQRTFAVATLSTLFALASCSGDENPSTSPQSKEIRPATPPVADASAATRQPASTMPAASPLEPVPPVAESTAPEAKDPPGDPPNDLANDPAMNAEVADAEAPLLSPEDAAIPTQEEADLEASQSINNDNADEELEKLEKELGAEGGG
jgi:hypothetical protein